MCHRKLNCRGINRKSFLRRQKSWCVDYGSVQRYSSSPKRGSWSRPEAFVFHHPVSLPLSYIKGHAVYRRRFSSLCRIVPCGARNDFSIEFRSGNCVDIELWSDLNWMVCLWSRKFVNAVSDWCIMKLSQISCDKHRFKVGYVFFFSFLVT